MLLEIMTEDLMGYGGRMKGMLEVTVEPKAPNKICRFTPVLHGRGFARA